METYYKSNQEEILQQVSELAAQYETKNVVRSKSFRRKNLFTNKLLLSAVIQKGIPYTLFKLIRQMSPFTENDWAGFLNISQKSLRRYSEEERHLKPIQSEKILEMAEVTDIGMEVFEDMDKLKLWLDTPNYALGELKPKDLIKDSYGKELVVAELTRVDHGIFA